MMNSPLSFKSLKELNKFLDKEKPQENECLEFKQQINHIKRKDIDFWGAVHLLDFFFGKSSGA